MLTLILISHKMGALALALSAAATTATANDQSSVRCLIPSHAPPRRRRRRRIINLSFPRKPTSKFIVFASKDNPMLDPRDQIEFKPLDIGSSEKRSAANAPLETKLVDSNIKFSMEALLQGKPKRLDQPVKGMPNFSREDMAFVNPEIYGNVVELENFLATSPIKEHEDNDWTMVEDLARTGGREEVKLISSSTRGFVVSFGSLIGFLPYCNLPARWKFLAFESWLRGKALDPSKYKQNLGVVGKYRIANKTSLDLSLGPEIDLKVDVDILPDMKLEDLLKIYDQEKLIFLSSFVGQKIKVYVASSDRKSKRLIFSVKPKEKKEMVEKKKSVMAKLSVGDVVKCCIKKITYFGIFVEVEGVTALIHPTQVSWDATLDHASYFRVGKIVKAKVHQLDFSLERIFLSLKETTVYMASMFENEYKLLARSGNRVQELKWIQKRIDLIGYLLLLGLCICLHLPNWPCWMVIYVATWRWSLDLDRHLSEGNKKEKQLFFADFFFIFFGSETYTTLFIL